MSHSFRKWSAVLADKDLTDIARQVRRDCLAAERYAEALCPGISKTVIASLKQVSDVKFGRVRSGAGFLLNAKTRVMTLNAARVRSILRIAHMRNSCLPMVERLDGDQIDRMGVGLYLLHEVVHIAQEIAKFSDVGWLKHIAGGDYLAELDLCADVEAARTIAALECFPDGTRAHGYVQHFAGSIFFMISNCFPVFGFRGKRGKISRALGLALNFLLAQAYMEKRTVGLRGEPHFDQPLFPIIAEDSRSVLIKSLEAGGKVVALHRSINPRAVNELEKVLDSGRAELVLIRAQQVLLPAA